MGRTADLTVVPKTLIDTFHKDGWPQKVGAGRRVLYQMGKVWWEKGVQYKQRDDGSLERIV